MAKSKSKGGIKTILSLVAMVLCLLTIVTFFIPSLKSTDEDGTVKISSMEAAFVSTESATEKGKNAESLEEAGKYASIVLLRSDADADSALTAAGVTHFIAAIASAVAVVFLTLGLFGKKVSLLSKVACLAAAALMIASLISYIAFLNVEVGNALISSKISETVKLSAGVIIGLISSILAFVPLVLKFRKAK